MFAQRPLFRPRQVKLRQRQMAKIRTIHMYTCMWIVEKTNYILFYPELLQGINKV